LIKPIFFRARESEPGQFLFYSGVPSALFTDNLVKLPSRCRVLVPVALNFFTSINTIEDGEALCLFCPSEDELFWSVLLVDQANILNTQIFFWNGFEGASFMFLQKFRPHPFTWRWQPPKACWSFSFLLSRGLRKVFIAFWPRFFT